jgi:hypothetical protein
MKFPFSELMLHKIRDEKFWNLQKWNFVERLSPKKEMIGIAEEIMWFLLNNSTRLDSINTSWVEFTYNSTRLDSFGALSMI